MLSTFLLVKTQQALEICTYREETGGCQGEGEGRASSCGVNGLGSKAQHGDVTDGAETVRRGDRWQLHL